MAKKLAIAIIHGMGSHNKTEKQLHIFAKPMIDELNKRVKGYGKDPDQIA